MSTSGYGKCATSLFERLRDVLLTDREGVQSRGVFQQPLERGRPALDPVPSTFGGGCLRAPAAATLSERMK